MLLSFRSLTNDYHDRRYQSDLKNTNSWKVRNDSSEVGALLRPDTMPLGKLILASKKPREPCSDIAPRRPVKECYCRLETSKPRPRSSRTQHHKRASPCRHCRSHPELGTIGETEDKAALSSPISCETFRRIQRIDYTPRSQFLRNVQTKICEIHSGGQGDHSRACPRSSSYRRFAASTKMPSTPPDARTAPSNEHEQVDDRQTFPTSPRTPANSLASKQSETESDNVRISGKELRTPSQRPVKSKLRKTLRSTPGQGQVSDMSEQQLDLSCRNKRATQSRENCPWCCQKQLAEGLPDSSGDTCREMYDLPEYHERRADERSRRDGGTALDDTVDQEVADLRKFRERNYFETHGSSHTLASYGSSGSLQQYLLNERLFPEPVGRIHRRDLVVTMPPCATTQKKRVHYFPRYVVRQEKNMSNANYKRKRCPSCPLIGHAVDLGILKARPPLNSLALKYQKQAA